MTSTLLVHTGDRLELIAVRTDCRAANYARYFSTPPPNLHMTLKPSETNMKDSIVVGYVQHS